MTEGILASIRPHVAEILQRSAMPGVVIAIAHDGSSIEHLVVGTDAHGDDFAADTLFPVASITRLVTALSVLRLSDVGALHYEDRLHAYLIPRLAVAAKRITCAFGRGIC